MISKELNEIKDYWIKKYPTIDIVVYTNEQQSKFFGKMISYNSSIDLEADTIGDLINQGETFLRSYMK